MIWVGIVIGLVAGAIIASALVAYGLVKMWENT